MIFHNFLLLVVCVIFFELWHLNIWIMLRLEYYCIWFLKFYNYIRARLDLVRHEWVQLRTTYLLELTSWAWLDPVGLEWIQSRTHVCQTGASWARISLFRWNLFCLIGLFEPKWIQSSYKTWLDQFGTNGPSLARMDPVKDYTCARLEPVGHE